MSEYQMKSVFIQCERCGKKLVKRLSNGLWHFKFGRDINGHENPPVDILIYGSLQMKCLNRDCGHINTLNYYPFAALQRTDNRENELQKSVGGDFRDNVKSDDQVIE